LFFPHRKLGVRERPKGPKTSIVNHYIKAPRGLLGRKKYRFRRRAITELERNRVEARPHRQTNRIARSAPNLNPLRQ
jgi:hypothetical protein